MAQTTMQQLDKTLGFMDLMAIAVGQIIGSGVMVMSISALGMTGRSVNIAFVVAAVLTCFGALPTIFMGSTIRVLGGTYTQAALFCGARFAGFWSVINIFSKMSMAMFGVGLANYTIQLVPGLASSAKALSLFWLTAFFILNYFGTDKMAKAQTIMFYLLIIALLMFTAFGLPKVHWSTYWGMGIDNTPLFTDGLAGLLEAASYLTFATGGATVIVMFSAEAINPIKDIPVVTIVSTVGVAVLYAFMSTCIGGILPIADVMAAGNLGVIAKEIMPLPCYYFFIVCGAIFALGTTLNSSIASALKPLMAAVDDGWFPKSLNKLSKYKTTPAWLLIFYVVNAAAILAGMDTGMIGKLVLFIGNVNNFILIAGIMKLPKLFPEAWEKSPFHLPDGVFKFALLCAMGVTLMQAVMNCRNQPTWVLISNAVMFVVALGYSTVMYNSGKITINPAYELM